MTNRRKIRKQFGAFLLEEILYQWPFIHKDSIDDLLICVKVVIQICLFVSSSTSVIGNHTYTKSVIFVLVTYLTLLAVELATS